MQNEPTRPDESIPDPSEESKFIGGGGGGNINPSMLMINREGGAFASQSEVVIMQALEPNERTHDFYDTVRDNHSASTSQMVMANNNNN